jgi:hypothetical protein
MVRFQVFLGKERCCGEGRALWVTSDVGCGGALAVLRLHSSLLSARIKIAGAYWA